MSKAEAVVFWAVLVALVNVTGCGEGKAARSERTAPAVPVRVRSVGARAEPHRIRLPGVVEANSSVSLSFGVPGRIERLPVEVSERLTEGALVAELDLQPLRRAQAIAEASLRRAELQAAAAESKLDRERRLFARGATSQERLDTAEREHLVAAAEKRAARMRFEAAQEDLERGTLRAPITGFVMEKLHERGEHVGARDPIVVLADLSAVKIGSSLSDAHVRHVHVGQEARITSTAWPRRSFVGEVARIGLAADPSTRTLPFEVRVESPDGALVPGSSVGVEIRAEGGAIVAIPVEALLRGESGEAYCFVLDGERDAARARRRNLVLGDIVGDHVEVLAGLADRDRLIVRGQRFLQDGDRVAIAEP